MNTLPIEMFIDKARIAIKSNQKSLNLDIKEVIALYDSLAVVMTRLAGSTEVVVIEDKKPDVLQVKMDGGLF
jgi:hypothetical protein